VNSHPGKAKEKEIIMATAYTRIPPYTQLTDASTVAISGPDGLATDYLFDAQSRALWFKDAQAATFLHGTTHISEDPIPGATCDTPGLLSANDKCKLDALLQTRIGVLGFQGAGFPDDGGWLQGDIILAAGTEFISLERIGNVVRFTVDSPVPLTCSCESCNQIFWVQDDTDTASVRPPVCSGKLPGVNSYGELKVYVFPQSTIVDPNNPSAKLNLKGNYPSLIFKRYDDTLSPGSAEFELTLKRSSLNKLVMETGWAFTPGAVGGVAECIWFTGLDADGKQTSFQFKPDSDSNALGMLLYKGNLITKKMGVVTGYDSSILTSNIYQWRQWDILNQKPIGDSYTATNVWMYKNPGSVSTGTSAQALMLDYTIDILPIGTLTDIWAFQVGEVNGVVNYRYFFNQRPSINPNQIWSTIDHVSFGDTVVARDIQNEIAHSVDGFPMTTDVQPATIYDDGRNIELSRWGITNYDVPIIPITANGVTGTGPVQASDLNGAYIDTTRPALLVYPNAHTSAGTAPFGNYQQPTMIWSRSSLKDGLIRIRMGRPGSPGTIGGLSSYFGPVIGRNYFDVLLKAKIDEEMEAYGQVEAIGTFDGYPFIQISGVAFHDIPKFGTIEIISTSSATAGKTFQFNRKTIFAGGTGTGTVKDLVMGSVLLNTYTGAEPYVGQAGDIVRFIQQDYSNPVARTIWNYQVVDGQPITTLQFTVGMLDMTKPYNYNTYPVEATEPQASDIIRGLNDTGTYGGPISSAIYQQNGLYFGTGTKPPSSVSSFFIVEGGSFGSSDGKEYWNELTIMVKSEQVWIWWNDLLIPPNANETNAQQNPPTFQITQPYYLMKDFSALTSASPAYYQKEMEGKYGIRCFPGAVIRDIDIKGQVQLFNEYIYGNLNLG